MKNQLDEIDRALVRQLQQDARVSNVDLARTVNLTEGAVRRRLDNLFKSGALRIIGVGDPHQLGLTTHALIGMRVEAKRIGDVISELVQMPQFSFVYQTLGQFDALGVGFFESNADLGRFVAETLAKVDGLVSMETFLIMSTPKRHFLFGEEPDDA